MHPARFALSEPPALTKRAFTLIELLVVISIIALLVALILPVLSKSKEAGFRAKCASGARQANAAVRMYAMDNKEYVPTRDWVGYTGFQALIADGTYTNPGGAAGDGATRPGGAYTTRDNFTNKGGCPYGPRVFYQSCGTVYYLDPGDPETSYGLPGQLQVGQGVGPSGVMFYGPFRFSERRLTNRSTTVATISCSHAAWHGASNYLAPSPTEWTSWGASAPTGYPVLHQALGTPLWLLPTQLTGFRHQGEGLPMAFADGHAEFVPREEIMDIEPGYYHSIKYPRMRDTFATKYYIAGID